MTARPERVFRRKRKRNQHDRFLTKREAALHPTLSGSLQNKPEKKVK